MNTKYYIFLLSIMCFSINLSANEINNADVEEQNTLSDANQLTSASDSIDDWADNAVMHFGRNSGEFGEKNGKFILYASQAVSLKSSDPEYGDALINAFDKAMIKVQESYLMSRFGRTVVEKTKQFYADRSTNAKELELPAPDSPAFVEKVLDVFNKGLDVASKKLDKELIEMGEDPEEIKKMPINIKKNLMRDKFLKTTLRKASGSISGLFPIQTSYVSDDKGTSVVGVIAIATAKTIQVAKDIKLQRKSLIKGKGRDISQLLPQQGQDFLHTFGTRFTYDEDGTPAIISYGLASYQMNAGDDYINSELKSEARAEAISNADAQIAEIINGHMNVNNERKRGEVINQFVEREVKVGSDITEKTIKNIIKITNNQVKSTASAKLQGISTLKNWRYTSATGQRFVGAVRVWKYSTLKAVNSFNRKKSSVTKQKNSYKTINRTSQPINSMDDF